MHWCRLQWRTVNWHCLLACCMQQILRQLKKLWNHCLTCYLGSNKRWHRVAVQFVYCGQERYGAIISQQNQTRVVTEILQILRWPLASHRHINHANSLNLQRRNTWLCDTTKETSWHVCRLADQQSGDQINKIVGTHQSLQVRHHTAERRLVQAIFIKHFD